MLNLTFVHASLRQPDYLPCDDLLEKKYTEYFLKCPYSVLATTNYNEFWSFEEKDLQDSWGYFLLPIEDKDITGPNNVKHVHAAGKGLFSFSHLLN